MLRLESLIDVFYSGIYDESSEAIEGIVSDNMRDSEKHISGNAKERLIRTRMHDAFLIHLSLEQAPHGKGRYFPCMTLKLQHHEDTYEIMFHKAKYICFGGDMVNLSFSFPPNDGTSLPIAQILNIWISENNGLEVIILMDNGRNIRILCGNCVVNSA